MKIFKHIILISILSIVSNDIKCQCFFENIFPVNTGISKFDSYNKIAFIKSLKEIKKTRNNDFYSSFGHLKGDSVLKSWVNFEYHNHDCFNGDENDLSLIFADDKLYNITIKLSFNKDKLKECLDNYNNLISILKNKYKFFETFTTTTNDTNEKIGEGYKFYSSPKESRSTTKIEVIEIEMYAKYEYVTDNITNELKKSNNIEKYIIELNNINLNGTKLTNLGY
jgi:hypothetical protein